MNNNNYSIDLNTALRLACLEVGLENAALESAKLAGGYWELELSADEMRYDCFVDAESGEVCGLDFYPVPVEEYPAELQEPAGRKAA